MLINKNEITMSGYREECVYDDAPDEASFCTDASRTYEPFTLKIAESDVHDGWCEFTEDSDDGVSVWGSEYHFSFKVNDGDWLTIPDEIGKYISNLESEAESMTERLDDDILHITNLENALDDLNAKLKEKA